MPRVDAYLIAGGKWHDINHARLELLKLLAEDDEPDESDASDGGDVDPLEREVIDTMRRIEIADMPARVSAAARTEVERLRSVGGVGPGRAHRHGLARPCRDEPFGAEGRPLQDEPVRVTGLTAGAGISWSGVRLNLAFENRNMSYEDVMGSAVHYNSLTRQMFVADVSYSFSIPW